jgi:hypothetical protein
MKNVIVYFSSERIFIGIKQIEPFPEIVQSYTRSAFVLIAFWKIDIACRKNNFMFGCMKAEMDLGRLGRGDAMLKSIFY